MIFIPVADAAEVTPPLPAPTILLFGANWCAPCMAELRGLPAIAAAAAPAHIVVAWLDGPPRLPPGTPVDRVRPVHGAAAQALLDQWGGAAGLPYAVLLQPDGTRCREVRGPLQTSALGELVAGCGEGHR